MHDHEHDHDERDGEVAGRVEERSCARRRRGAWARAGDDRSPRRRRGPLRRARSRAARPHCARLRPDRDRSRRARRRRRGAGAGAPESRARSEDRVGGSRRVATTAARGSLRRAQRRSRAPRAARACARLAPLDRARRAAPDALFGSSPTATRARATGSCAPGLHRGAGSRRRAIGQIARAPLRRARLRSASRRGLRHRRWRRCRAGRSDDRAPLARGSVACRAAARRVNDRSARARPTAKRRTARGRR